MKRDCHSERLGVEAAVEDLHIALKFTKTDDEIQKVQGPLTTASPPASPRQAPGKLPPFSGKRPWRVRKIIEKMWDWMRRKSAQVTFL